MLERYRNWLFAKQFSRQTVRSYMARVGFFLKEYPDPLTITEIDIENYLSNLRNAGRSISSITATFYALKSFFTFLNTRYDETIISFHNPLRDLMPVRREKRIAKIIPEDDLSALLRAPDLKKLRGCRDYVVMLFLLHGLRAQEICDLRLDSIFVDGWGAGRRMIIDVKGKGLKERRMLMERSGDTEWAWKRYLKKRNGDDCSFAFPAILGRGRLKKLTANGLYRMLARYGSRLGIKKTHPHLWRHTTAVQLIQDGISIKEIQLYLGHESVATTERYLSAATLSQENAANSKWIHNLKKADARFRRWRK